MTKDTYCNDNDSEGLKKTMIDEPCQCCLRVEMMRMIKMTFNEARRLRMVFFLDNVSVRKS